MGEDRDGVEQKVQVAQCAELLAVQTLWWSRSKATSILVVSYCACILVLTTVSSLTQATFAYFIADSKNLLSSQVAIIRENPPV